MILEVGKRYKVVYRRGIDRKLRGLVGEYLGVGGFDKRQFHFRLGTEEGIALIHSSGIVSARITDLELGLIKKK